MKRCPECNRTFSDGTLSFCLVDGAILSAPYDPHATLVIPEPIQTEPPPTQVLPVEEVKEEIPPTIASPEPKRKRQEAPLSVASPVNASQKTLKASAISDTPAPSVNKSNRLKWVVGSVAALVVVSLIAFAVSRSNSSTTTNNPQPTNSAQALIVSQAGGGQYQTINEALKNAPAGSRILVRPGLYKESLVLDKKIEIIADGPREQIIIESTNANGITMRTDSAMVKGLTVRSRNASRAFVIKDTQVSFSTVSYDQKKPDWTPPPTSEPIPTREQPTQPPKRRVTATPKPTQRNNPVSRGTQAPASPSSRGEPTPTPVSPQSSSQYYAVEIAQGELVLEDCDITSEFLVAIKIHGKETKPIIRGCRIHDSNGVGVRVTDYAAGRIEKCEIVGNSDAGVQISKGANPTIQNCRINRNRVGMAISEGGAGTIQGNDLSSNTSGAWDIQSKETMRREGNTE